MYALKYVTMSSDDNISDTELSSNYTSEDELLDTVDVSTFLSINMDASSDDESAIDQKRKRLRRDSEMSSSSETEDSTFTPIAPTKTFSKATDDFLDTPGPRRAPPSNASPIDYFNLFFTPSLLESIVIETNRYASQFIQSHDLSDNSRIKKWTETNVQEIRAFIAVLLEMGITKKPTMYCYWRQNSRVIPWFGKMFARDRFLLLLKFFHLVDNQLLVAPGHPDYDPCARFEMLVKHANTVFHKHYVPYKQLYIDESLVGTHCHSSIKQYLPNKLHHKLGMNFWMLCDSITKYCLGFYCYKGANNEEDRNLVKKNGLGFLVVENLLENYLEKGYHLFTDNFYTSLHLAKSLLKRKTYLTGTIHQNMKEIPAEAKKAEAGVPKYFANQNILMCSFKDKKTKPRPAILISSNANSNSVRLTEKKGNFEYTKETPSMIHDYKIYMRKVNEGDESDKMLYANLDERRTCKLWKKVVFNIFGRMVLNGYILYKSNTTEKTMPRLKFTSAIIGQIEEEWMTFRNMEIEESTPMPSFGLEKLPGRNLRQCAVCSSRKYGIKRSNLICCRCKKGLHGLCAGKHKC